MATYKARNVMNDRSTGYGIIQPGARAQATPKPPKPQPAAVPAGVEDFEGWRKTEAQIQEKRAQVKGARELTRRMGR
jgi:hypothetical protein